VRIPTDFALLTPGVLGGQQRPGSAQTATTSLSLDGSADAQTDVLVDGMSAGQFQKFGSFHGNGNASRCHRRVQYHRRILHRGIRHGAHGAGQFQPEIRNKPISRQLFENFRNRSLNARAFFELEKLPFQQN
jgi:hypothetical protein